MLNYINYIASRMGPVIKFVDILWGGVLGCVGILLILAISATSLYAIVEYIVRTRDILYVSIPSFLVVLLCILLYVYQWKRYKVMMWIQHKVRIKYPLIHKLLFLSILDPIVYRLNAPGLFLITCCFILYYLCVVIILFFLSNSREISLTKKYEDSYLISMMLCFLFISYWLNKIILAIVFWVLVFFVLFLIVLIYSIIYCLCARKRIEQHEEEERQRNIEERYRYDNDNDSEEGNNENNSIESSTSQTRVVLKQLINSMKKSFTINHKYSKQSATSCSICFIDFVEKDTVIELKCDTKHTFHDACLHAWTREHDTCPLCRKRIES